jgi:two-component system chemotaxis response regulator CheB
MSGHKVSGKIRVLIVEDSAVVREFLQYVIKRDSRLEVIAAVGSAEEALLILDRISPDVISMDIRLPGINGLEATRRIMSQRPTPVVIVSTSVESDDLKIAIKALEAGALTVLEKPVGTTNKDYETLAERLCTQLAIMSQVKLVRQHPKPEPHAPVLVAPRRQPFATLGIVGSTGGPAALVRLLGDVGPAFALPILLVQHITASFLNEFAVWLESVCPFAVSVVKDAAVLAAGTIYLAGIDGHLTACAGGLVRWESGDPVCAQRPSGTVLFQSMARTLGPTAIGVLLTGMGEDGAIGLLEMRQAGGYTIAEDQSTAVVYGMPAAAVRLGAVCESLPLPEIGPRLKMLAPLHARTNISVAPKAC